MQIRGDREATSMRCSYPTSPLINASGSSMVMSKKVKAGPFVVEDPPECKRDWIFRLGDGKASGKPLVVYQRRRKREQMEKKFELVLVKAEIEEGAAGDECESRKRRRLAETDEVAVFRRRTRSSLGDGVISTRTRARAVKNRVRYSQTTRTRAVKNEVRYSRMRARMVKDEVQCYQTQVRTRVVKEEVPCSEMRAMNGVIADGKSKRWLYLSLEDADPFNLVGLSCRVFWQSDDQWYPGSISKYTSSTQKHEVLYNDGDVESLILSREKVKFHLTPGEMKLRNLKCSLPNMSAGESLHNELIALAFSYDDCGSFGSGDIVWVKLAGHPVWPAVIVDEDCAVRLGVLKPIKGDKVAYVQFFGTYDFARVNVKQVKSFLSGLLSLFDLKCKQERFERSLQEAKMYLSCQRLPSEMTQKQKGSTVRESKSAESEDEGKSDASDDHDKKDAASNDAVDVFPLEIGSLSVFSLGNIICDSEFFHSRCHIWPEGYSAARKFISISNPNVTASYKMEVLRNPKVRDKPLFRVITENGKHIDGATPKVCWKKIYKRIKDACNALSVAVEETKLRKSGSYMFGFSNARISQLIQDLPNSALCAKYFGRVWDLPPGYVPVHYPRKDIDRCDVCNMDEEYEDNLYLQCDKCHMNVHAKCYGEVKSPDGVLWMCNLCRDGAPESPPRCCLCPVTGGAIKPTTDGRWAHLTCAIWIPETCLLDVKKMEPIDGVSRINKKRWKLLCSICGVSHGACIQCSKSNCYVAYHPLCARAAGLCFEHEDEDDHHLISDDDDNAHSIRLLSFCKKHMPLRKELGTAQEVPLEPSKMLSAFDYSNPSGCARCEQYNSFGMRGSKESHVTLAASKQLFLQNTPYLLSGCRQSGSSVNESVTDSLQVLSFAGVMKHWMPQEASSNCSSLAEKYLHMKDTCRKRLAFGKSKVHGFGVFAKVPHKTGDMIVEYSGEIVRPRVADTREHRIYNSLVGAGTYMFHIDNERVIDATKAGSIAHLINHSCEPNCYSRTITIQGEEHIIICAKRDIKQWEELAYDYRFLSIDERLACFCGSSKCQGVVNDVEVIEQSAQLWVPRSELIPCSGD